MLASCGQLRQQIDVGANNVLTVFSSMRDWTFWEAIAGDILEDVENRDRKMFIEDGVRLRCDGRLHKCLYRRG